MAPLWSDSRHRFRVSRRTLLVAGLAVVAILALGGHGHPTTHRASPGAAVPIAAVLTADHGSTSTTSTTTPPGYSGSGSGPTGIQVGPGGTTTPTTPTPGSGGTVSGGTQPSPGLFDITGHIEAAIDDWFRDLVTAALDPILTCSATPCSPPPTSPPNRGWASCGR